jgi:hypothetical protein
MCDIYAKETSVIVWLGGPEPKSANVFDVLLSLAYIWVERMKEAKMEENAASYVLTQRPKNESLFRSKDDMFWIPLNEVNVAPTRYDDN